MNQMRKIAAVIGRPVLHSLSPNLYLSAIRSLGINGGYLRIAANDTSEALRLMKEMSLVGLNVTAPFKEDLYKFCNEISSDTKAIKAVNTILSIEDKLYGYNTDCYGIKRSLKVAKDAKAVILGGGGAARAAVYVLKRSGAIVSVLNRTLEKALKIADEFGVSAANLSVESQKQYIRPANIIINCTSAFETIVDSDNLNREQILLESQYSGETALAKDLKNIGGKVISGKEWLVNQAVEAFKLFFDINAERELFEYGLNEFKYKKPILLGGLMGSGKTSIGRVLAEKMGRRFIDLDSIIEREQGRSIFDIFHKLGEAKFRVLEEDVLRRAISEQDVLISTGGGVVLSKANRELIKKKGLFIWLWATPVELERRLKDDYTRPLLEDRGLSNKLTELLEERFDLYQEVCELVVPTEGHEVSRIADRIMYEINNARCD